MPFSEAVITCQEGRLMMDLDLSVINWAKSGRKFGICQAHSQNMWQRKRASGNNTAWMFWWLYVNGRACGSELWPWYVARRTPAANTNKLCYNWPDYGKWFSRDPCMDRQKWVRTQTEASQHKINLCFCEIWIPVDVQKPCTMITS